MKISKFFHSLQFRLVAIVLGIFVVSNIVLVSVSMNLSTVSVTASVESLLNAVTDSASGKIKGETEKSYRVLETLALMDSITSEDTPLIEKCRQLTHISKVSDEYENIAYYDLAETATLRPDKKFNCSGRI